MTLVIQSDGGSEDSHATLLAYLEGADGQGVTQAGVASIEYTVYDASTGSAVGGHDAVALTVADVIFDALQTFALDPRWRNETTGLALPGGANFIHEVPYTAFPAGDRWYEYEASVTETGGAQWVLQARRYCRSVRRS